MRTAARLLEDHSGWMGWNLALALIPVAVGFVVFQPRRRRTGWWWIGVAVFGAFLPNAPYVVSDLVHLPADLHNAHSTKVALGGLLPLYGAFVLAGVEAYAVSLALVRRYLRAAGAGALVPWVEAATHALCTVGVVFGRVDRLNSWDPFTRPDRVARAVLTIGSRPGLVLAVGLIIVGTTHFVTKADTIALRAGRWALAVFRPSPLEPQL